MRRLISLAAIGVAALALRAGAVPPAAPTAPTADKVTEAVKTLNDPASSDPAKATATQTIDSNSYPCTNTDAKSSAISHWCGDAVTVPVKIQLTGNKDVQGSANLGYFFGYNLVALHKQWFLDSNTGTFPGLYVGPFFGATSVSTTSSKTSSTTNTGTTQTTSSSSTPSTAAGFDYGIGLTANVGEIGGRNLHVGVYFGHDHTGTGNNYAYNERNWIGVSFAIPTN